MDWAPDLREEAVPLAKTPGPDDPFILRRVEIALNGRTWTWLSRESSVPRTTFMSASATPYFSVNVLARISKGLRVEIGYFFPEELSRRPASQVAGRARRAVVRVSYSKRSRG